LIESITDPEVGLDFSPDFAYPCAWGDSLNGEIADICDSSADATFLGSDGQIYSVQKGFSNQSNSCVAASVPPLARNQNVTNYQNSPLAITLSGSDTNNYCVRPLTFSVTTNPAHGALAGVAPNLIYTSAAGFLGQDSFQFKVSDGIQSSSPATVSITVVNWPNVTPIVLTSLTRLGDGTFRFAFTNVSGASFSVFATTNVATPFDTWSNLGLAIESPTGSGSYQFTDSQATGLVGRSYRVRFP
jgi:hypothetical protein